MSTLKHILILEDEPLNAARLQRLLLKIRPDLKIMDVLPSVKKAVDWLSVHPSPDLVIMDIRLADGLSFEVFKLAELSCPVMFTTAFDEYAIQAFKYNSIDYLLKPVEQEELEAAIRKLENTAQPLQPQYTLIEELMEQIRPKPYRTRFLLPYRDEYLKIDIADIAFFYSHTAITHARLFNGKQMVIPHTLETLEQELEPRDFFRVNRQYIVHAGAIDKVHNFFNGKLKLDVKNSPDHEVLVSRTKAASFKTWLGY